MSHNPWMADVDLPQFGPGKYRGAALAAAFILHEHNENVEGMSAIVDEVNESNQLLSDFMRGLSAFAVNYGRRLQGDEFAEKLQEMAIRLQRDAEILGDDPTS